jgi:F-type H+-transporting ATPase subunit delta
MDPNVEHATVLDTTQQRAGEIYARALLAIGRNTGQMDELLAQLDSFVDDVVRKLPLLGQALDSPRLNQAQKERVIDRALAKGATADFRNFVKVLTRKNRFGAIRAVQAAAHKLYNEYRGRVAATLITASPPGSEVLQWANQTLARQLGKEIDLRSQIDPTIIGGAVIRVGDTVYDGSVKNQLRRVRASAIQKSYQQIRDTFERFVTET